jgi:3-hydroxybutyryl-CoA dehydratase
MHWSHPFEDLSLGARFVSESRTVADADVLVFCALTGDWHPQHCDARWAASSAFGERIAHGMLILSLAVGLVPLDPERVIALRRVGDVVFKRAVRLGDTIAVATELTALRAVDPGTGLVGFGWAIRNQEQALVARASVEVLWRRREAPLDTTAPPFWHEAVVSGGRPGEFVPLPL